MTPEQLQNFRDRFPELSEKTDDQVRMAFEDAEQVHVLSLTGTMYAAAHLLTVEDKREVKRSEAGDVSVEFFQMGSDASDTFWAATKYGRRFLEIQQRFSANAILVA